MKECDVLIIGAGPSGSVTASILQQKGFHVKIIEKQKFPRFVIGESLLPRCMDNLEKAGLLDIVKQAGFQEKLGAKFERNGEVCDFNFEEQYTQGWTWTWQVPRSDFDKTLADYVADKGVEIEYEASVVDVSFQQDCSSVVSIEDKYGERKQVHARFLVDASGYGRVLPRLLKLDAPSDFPVRTALFCHLTDENRPEGSEGNRITVIVYQQDVWIWMIPFSNGITSIGVVGAPDAVNQFEGDANQQLEQWIKEIPKLESRFGSSSRMMNAKNINGYSVAVSQLYGSGYVLLGNSTEFLDPIFSSGVTLATESAVVAAELISRQLKGQEVDWEREFSEYIKYGVNVFRTYVEAWYNGKLPHIFFHPESNEQIKRQICSVLAGYVWDTTNPYVKLHQKSVNTLYKFLKQKSHS